MSKPNTVLTITIHREEGMEGKIQCNFNEGTPDEFITCISCALCNLIQALKRRSHKDLTAYILTQLNRRVINRMNIPVEPQVNNEVIFDMRELGKAVEQHEREQEAGGRQ